LKLNLEDFKKANYKIKDSALVTKQFNPNCNVDIFILEDEMICTMYIYNSNISYIEIPVDKLATIEEIESTIAGMYDAVVGV